MPRDKGKSVEGRLNPSAVPVLNTPAAGSTNPAASMPALWSYIQPALDHILRSPTNNSNGKAPALEIAFYSGIHSACYNYFTSARIQQKLDPHRMEVYHQLDRYFGEVCQEIFANAPHDDTALINYIIPYYDRYTSGVQSTSRLLSYANRHYVSRATEEDKGWIRITDVIDSVSKDISPDDTREVVSDKLRERRLRELKRWGYEEDGSGVSMAVAEACAEASSAHDRIVPFSSLAMRQFRTEIVEPLLAKPKIPWGKPKLKPKSRNKEQSGPSTPKGRLARAVKTLVESTTIPEDERLETIKKLARMLMLSGVNPDHVLRRKLGKVIARATAKRAGSPATIASSSSASASS